MDLGLIINPLHQGGTTRPPEKFDEVLARIRLAEEWGFSTVWITEHHFVRYSRPASAVTLAAAAALTSRIRLGLAVSVLPLNHPITVAEQLATLDHISHGRVDAGIGRGLFPLEFSGFCVPMEEAQARFDEGVDLLLRAWTSDAPFSFHGRFHQVQDVVVYPRPFQSPHPPIFQAMVSPGSFDKVAGRGFHGLVGPYLTPLETLKRTAFEPWAAAKRKYGRPHLRGAHNEIVYVGATREAAFREARESVMAYVRASAEFWGDTDDPVWVERYGQWAPMVHLFKTVSWEEVFDDLIIAGDVDHVAERLQALAECGVDEVIVYPCDLDFDLTSASLERLAKDVLPKLRRRGDAPAAEPSRSPRGEVHVSD